jgi:polysaccharide export outer membrane protein
VCLVISVIALLASGAAAMPPTGAGQKAAVASMPSGKVPTSKTAFGGDEDAKANYRIAIGDLLDIRVLGESDMNAEVRVSNTGDVRVPYISEDIRAQCMTERQLGSTIAEKLKKILRFPEVSVTVKEYTGGTVAVMGAVRSQGRYQLPRQMSVLELLINAGGVDDKAGRYARLIHMVTLETDPCAPPAASPVATAGPEEATPAAATGDAPPAATPVADAASIIASMESVDLRKLFNGDLSENRKLRAGDILMIPSSDVVFISGEVAKPGQMVLRDGLTLSQAIAMAGGTTDVAKADAVTITRVVNGQQQDIVVNLKDVKKSKGTDPVLMANDIVEVPDSSGKKFRQGLVQSLVNGAVGLPLRVARGGW